MTGAQRIVGEFREGPHSRLRRSEVPLERQLSRDRAYATRLPSLFLFAAFFVLCVCEFQIFPALTLCEASWNPTRSRQQPCGGRAFSTLWVASTSRLCTATRTGTCGSAQPRMVRGEELSTRDICASMLLRFLLAHDICHHHSFAHNVVRFTEWRCSRGCQATGACRYRSRWTGTAGRLLRSLSRTGRPGPKKGRRASWNAPGSCILRSLRATFRS